MWPWRHWGSWPCGAGLRPLASRWPVPLPGSAPTPGLPSYCAELTRPRSWRWPRLWARPCGAGSSPGV
eukprot:3860037-Alexandrium_andersonii.AAC.1